MSLLIKIIMDVLKVSTEIIISIIARPVGLAEILLIISVSTFKTPVILYVLSKFQYPRLERNYIHIQEILL